MAFGRHLALSTQLLFLISVNPWSVTATITRASSYASTPAYAIPPSPASAGPATPDVGWRASGTPSLVPSRPSSVVLDGVSQSYPITLLSKLFSSVPKREFALRDASLTIGAAEAPSSVTILVGRSGSGKSTLLRLLAGIEIPIEGKVRMGHAIGGDDINGGKQECCAVATPVMVDRKPDVYGDSRPILERIVAAGINAAMHSCPKQQVSIETNLYEALASDFCAILGLGDEQLRSIASDLNPSAVFLFGMACACMESSCPALCSHHPAQNKNEKEVATQDIVKTSGGIPYPILLLDELFDFEHPSIAAKCAVGLDRLAKSGAAVAVATHKPHHWEGVVDRIVVTLNGGEII